MGRMANVLVALGSVVLAACGGGDDSSEQVPTTATGELTTTTEGRSCTDLTDEAIAALVAVFDRIGVDRSDTEDDLAEVLTHLEADLDGTCGISGTAPALSEIVEFLAEQGRSPGQAGELALRTLDGVCSGTTANDIRLTGDGDLECIGHGGDPFWLLGYLHFDGTLGSARIGASGTGFDRCEDSAAGTRTYELPDTFWFDGGEALEGYDLRVTRIAEGATTFTLVPPDPAGVELVGSVGPGPDPRIDAPEDGSSIVFLRIELRDASGNAVGVLSGGVDCLAPPGPPIDL